MRDNAERAKHESRGQFDRWAHTYDRSWLNEFVFLPAVRACLEQIRRARAAGSAGRFRALDVGCGTGTLVTLLAGDPACERAVGLDFSPAMARRAAEKLDRLDLGARASIVVGDSERLPFADAAFDFVTCCHSFHHYPRQSAVMREFHRVLRPGGALILIDGFRDNVIGWLIFDLVVAGVERNVHHASWSEVRNLLHEAGFASWRQRKLNVLAPLLVSVALR